jgi:hypothetical protein
VLHHLERTRAAAQPAPTSGLGGEDGLTSKPQLGKNPHSEGIKTKRDLQHDHHLNRRGKGTWAGKS